MPRVDGRVDAQGELLVSSDELIASARRAQPGVGKQFLEGLILHDVVHHLGQFCHHHGGNVRERCVCAARRRLAATTVRSGLRAAPASKPASPDLCQTHVHVAVDEPLEYGHVADGTPNRTRSILLARSSRRDGLRRGLPPAQSPRAVLIQQIHDLRLKFRRTVPVLPFDRTRVHVIISVPIILVLAVILILDVFIFLVVVILGILRRCRSASCAPSASLRRRHVGARRNPRARSRSSPTGGWRLGLAIVR